MTLYCDKCLNETDYLVDASIDDGHGRTEERHLCEACFEEAMAGVDDGP